MARTPASLKLVEPGPLPTPSGSTVTASARPLPLNRNFTPQYTEGQQAAFDLWRQVDAFYAGVRWLANAMSRVRLVVATTTDDGTAPERLDSGPAVDLLNRLSGGAGGQSQLLSELAIHFSVTGECWLVGETADPTGEFGGAPVETWRVMSAAELRIADSANSRRQFGATTTYEIRDGIPAKNGMPPWRPINPDSLVVRCWRQDPQFGWMADAPGLHAMPALVLLDLADKRIQAEILSRLAGNGILLYDSLRLSIPGRTPGQGADVNAPDAFGEMLVEVASQGIANPASPSSTLPIPIGTNISDLTDVDPKTLMQLIEFPTQITEKLLDIRTMAVSRVATALDIPDEYLNQTRTDLNHWSLSQVSSDAIDGPISAMAELLCNCISEGFLAPAMASLNLDVRNADGSRTIVWFDPSELETPPESGEDAKAAYDRAAITEEAYRRRIGETEDAAPSVEEETRILLKAQAAKGSIVALQILNGDVELADAAQTADPGVRESGAPGSEREAPVAPPVGSEPATSPDDAPPVTASAQHVVIEYRKRVPDPVPVADDDE